MNHRFPARRGASRTILLMLASCRGDPDARAVPTAAPPPARLSPIELPAARHGHRLELLDGGLLCFGGFGDDDAADRGARDVLWLAPRSSEWQARAPMPAERAFFASAVVAGRAHAIGDGIESYDLAADRWVELVPPGSLPRSHFGAAALGRTIYVLGGYPLERSGFFAIDVEDGTVRAEPPPPGFTPGDHFHLVHALDGRLHVIGGLDVASFEPRAEHWVLEDGGWKGLPKPPVALWAKFLVQACDGDSLYVFDETMGWRFDAREGTWTKRAPIPVTLAMAPAVALDRTIWVVGGLPVGGEPARELFAYDLAADAWRRIDVQARR